jgi:hypothetical protein
MAGDDSSPHRDPRFAYPVARRASLSQAGHWMTKGGVVRELLRRYRNWRFNRWQERIVHTRQDDRFDIW